jgi:gamma-glutamyltranspeptidase
MKHLKKLTSKKNGKLVTYEDFLGYGNKVMKPVFEDYRKLFIDASGPFKKLTIVYGAARVLNRLMAAQMDNDMIEELDVYALKVAETE